MTTFTAPMELIHSYNDTVVVDGRKFRAKVFGDEQWDGAWHGFVAFFPRGKRGAEPVATDLDSVQPNKTALAWWAGGLTADYLHGALKRALFLDAHPEERTETAKAATQLR
jgi:hypothetical protein